MKHLHYSDLRPTVFNKTPVYFFLFKKNKFPEMKVSLF